MSSVDFKRLASPFSKDELTWRIVSAGHKRSGEPWAIAVPYLDARSIQSRLDDVVGPAHWQTKYSAVGRGYLCELSIRIGEEWITKVDGSEETDQEPFKGAISRALVRAAVHWGIGRYLYGMPTTFVHFAPSGTPGATRLEIDGQEYFWTLAEPEKKKDDSPGPVLVKAAVASPAPAISRPASSGLVIQSEAPEATIVPFGRLQGKKLSELTPDELQSLSDWYATVQHPQGKAKSFKKSLDAFLLRKVGTVSA